MSLEMLVNLATICPRMEKVLKQVAHASCEEEMISIVCSEESHKIFETYIEMASQLGEPKLEQVARSAQALIRMARDIKTTGAIVDFFVTAIEAHKSMEKAS